jgi:hypothetical protein
MKRIIQLLRLSARSTQLNSTMHNLHRYIIDQRKIFYNGFSINMEVIINASKFSNVSHNYIKYLNIKIDVDTWSTEKVKCYRLHTIYYTQLCKRLCNAKNLIEEVSHNRHTYKLTMTGYYVKSEVLCAVES